MKALLAIVICALIGAQVYSTIQLNNISDELRAQRELDYERYLFYTDMHIYNFSVRETFDLFTKLTYARLLKLEGAHGMESSIKDLNAAYEKAARLTEYEWKMLKKKHPDQVKEFALKYEAWLKDREVQPQ